MKLEDAIDYYEGMVRAYEALDIDCSYNLEVIAYLLNIISKAEHLASESALVEFWGRV